MLLMPPRLFVALLLTLSAWDSPVPPGRTIAERDPTFAVHDSVVAQLSSVGDMALDEDGSLYLADYRFPAVLHLEPTGALRRAIGRAGSGPGEFRNVLFLGLHADSLWVLDPGQARVTLFPPSGRGPITIPYGGLATPVRGATRPQSRRGTPMAILPDGDFLVRENIPLTANPADGTSQAVLLSTDRNMLVTDTLAVLPARHSSLVFVYEDGESHFRQPFSDDPMSATNTDGSTLVVVTRAAARSRAEQRFKVTAWRGGREPAFSRELEYRPEPLRAATVDSVVRFMASPPGYDGPPTPITADSIRRRLFRPDFHPPVEQLTAGRDGTIWLKVRFADSPAGQGDWLVLSPRGLPLDRVTAPADFRLLEATRTAMYGVEGDPTDVPRVVRYRLGK